MIGTLGTNMARVSLCFFVLVSAGLRPSTAGETKGLAINRFLWLLKKLCRTFFNLLLLLFDHEQVVYTVVVVW